MLFDARLAQGGGKHVVVLHGLFLGLLDELLAGFHLAQRAFVRQAYTRVRTVEEVLEAIDVLLADGTLLENWIDDPTR